MVDRASEARVDATLQVIIVGFRLVTAVWITVLGVIAVVSWDARAGVVGATVALAWVWSAITIVALRSGKLDSLPWLVVDIVVALLVILTATIDGTTQGTFVGGFPMTAVLLWGYAYRIPGGLGASALLAATLIAVGESDLAGNTVTAILYLVVGGVAAWAFEVLRTSERRRLAAERALDEERAARIRSQERADLTAHLHDSVLQTLALIQKRSDQPNEVRSLARVQERELRTWLFGSNQDVETLVAALEQTCSEVERRTGVAVELVTVGDRRLDDQLTALVGATGESVMNAAKHAGVDKIAVFAEADADGVRVFVRDRGAGFDPAIVPADRRGIVESVIGRMERHGGAASIASSSGGGTEVRLSMPPREESPKESGA